MEASTKFCTHCGTPAIGERFCTHCGQPLHDEPTEGSSETSETSAGAPSGTAAEATSAATTAVREVPAPAQPPPPSPRAADSALEPASRRPSWLPIAISATVVFVLAAAVAVVLIAAGGKPSAKPKDPHTQATRLTNTLLASRQLYAATQQSSYSALLPAGWQQVSIALPGLTAALTVQSPINAGATITVGQVIKPAKTLSGTAGAVLKAAGSQPGFRQDVSSATTLAGGRHAWVLAYDATGKSAATYLVSSCGNTYAVSATVPPGHVSVLRPRIAIVAGTLQGNC